MLSPEEVADRLSRPLFRARASLREMSEAGYITQEKDKYVITEKGKEISEKTS